MAAMVAGGVSGIVVTGIVQRKEEVTLRLAFLYLFANTKRPDDIAAEQEEYDDIDENFFHNTILYNIFELRFPVITVFSALV